MPQYVPDQATLEDVTIIHRNFAGLEGRYNQEGEHTFSVVLDEDTAKAMEKDGWNVKHREGREEGDEGYWFLPIAFKYRARDGRRLRAPRITLLSSRGRTPLGENEVKLIDDINIDTADIIIRPRPWETGGNQGIKAYLQTMYITMKEDVLDKKYADYEPDTGEPPF
jgi:hypothetical protein